MASKRVGRLVVDSQDRLNSIMALRRQNDIIAMLLEGKESKDIVQYLVSKYNITPGTARGYMVEARDTIKQRSDHEIKNLLPLHIQRCEMLYNKLHELQADGTAMQALRHKEKLLGFHKEGFHMRVTQGQISSIQLQEITDEYNLNKLTPEQKSRFEQLIQKTKKKGDGHSKNDRSVQRSD